MTERDPDAGMVEVVKSRKKGRRLQIETQHGELYLFPAVTVLEYGIYVWYQFSRTRWQEILQKSALEECFASLTGLLSRRAHTVIEARRKLYKREFETPIVNATIERAAAIGLLDDAVFARLFAEERSRDGRYGRRRIEADLQRRGVDRKLIADAFEAVAKDSGHGDEMEYENALSVGRRKWTSLARVDDMDKRKKRLLSFLAGRGFASNICFRVIDALRHEDRDAG